MLSIKRSVVTVLALFSLAAPAWSEDLPPPTVTYPNVPVVSATLDNLPVAYPAKGKETARPAPRLRPKGPPQSTGPVPADPALQNKHFAARQVAAQQADGIGFTGYLPPDPDLAVGPSKVVQVVNSQVAVFDKSTMTMAAGYPKNLSNLWSSLGGSSPCAVNNAGDPSIAYDRLADRWVITQLGSVSSPYSECIAISQTSDPTGAYYLYSYSFGSSLNDYPKFSVWPSGNASDSLTGSAYLATYNMFYGSSGANLCGYDRKAMLSGNTAAQICQFLPNDYSYLPSDLDGSTPAPASGGITPAYFVTYGSLSSLTVRKAAFDFTAGTVSLTTSSITVPGFSEACGGGTCIPQPGTTRTLDSLGDRPMYRLSFRNFGSRQVMGFNHSVATSVNNAATVGIRWYELEDSGSGFGLKQSGTYAPDATYRWMGSLAINADESIAIGYSTASSSEYPGPRVAFRAAGDPPGTLGAEMVLQAGGGSQTGYSRWGDYASMHVDPLDENTFWYTGEYFPATSSASWKTVIAKFALQPDFSLSASPASFVLPQVASGVPASQAVNIAVQSIGNFTSTVSIAAPTCSAGMTLSLPSAPVNVAAGSSANGTLTPGTNSVGSYSCQISGTASSITHNTSVNVQIVPDFRLSTSTSTVTVRRGKSGSTTVTATKVQDSSNVGLSISGLPAGATARFSQSPITATGSTTLTLSTKPNTKTGSYALTITGNNGSMTNTVRLTLTVQ